MTASKKGSFGWSDLRAAGADARLLGVVDALTERDGGPEQVYLRRCASDPLAPRIKRATSPTNWMSRPLRPSTNGDTGELRRRV